MAEQVQADLKSAVVRLKQEHADFDAAVRAMIAIECDRLQIPQMQKKKLLIKDPL